MKILFKPTQASQQRQHEKQVWIWPVYMAMYATFLKNQNHKVCWDGIDDGSYDRVIKSEDDIDAHFLYLPYPDRILTDAFNPKYQNNGNFKHKPGTYTLASSGCWYGKCSFCVESNKCGVVTRKPEQVIADLLECEAMGFKEVFDDSGTFPDGEWLMKFCIAKRVTNDLEKLPFSCNMRIGADCDFKMMKQAGFRMLLFGVESANQITLDRLNKGIKAYEIIPYIKKAADAGLEPHIAVMFGYPWESEKEEFKTLELVHHCLRKGYAKTAQASIYRPQGEFLRNLETKPRPSEIYKAAYHFDFWFNKLKDIKSVQDVRYLFRGIMEGVSSWKR